MPHAGIHSCLETNWNPASDPSNACNIQMLSPPVVTLAVNATSLLHSSRTRPSSTTNNAPNNGTTTSDVRIGNGNDEVEAASIMRAILSRRTTRADRPFQAR